MHKKGNDSGELPIYLFKQGRNARAYEYFGAADLSFQTGAQRPRL